MPTLNEDVLQYCWYLCIYVGINFYVHLFASKNANILFIFLFVINYYFILISSKFLRRLSPKGQLEKEILRGSWESGYTIQEKSQINNTSQWQLLTRKPDIHTVYQFSILDVLSHTRQLYNRCFFLPPSVHLSHAIICLIGGKSTQHANLSVCIKNNCEELIKSHKENQSNTGCSLNIVFFQRFWNIFRTQASLGFPSASVCVYRTLCLDRCKAGSIPALLQKWQSSEK